MPNLSELNEENRIKLLLCSDSGGGKTSSIAHLANAGFKVRIFDYDNNLRIIKSYVKPEFEKNVSFISLNVSKDSIAPKGNSAVQETKKILENGWKTATEDLGKVQSWGTDTVLVFDTLTYLGTACLRHALAKEGKNYDEVQAFSQEIWGLGQKFADSFLKFCTSSNLKCNVIFNTHLKWMTSDGDALLKCYPQVVGSAMSPLVGRDFTDVWRIDTAKDAAGTKFFRTQSDIRMSLKCSNPTLIKNEEPFDLGLAFNKLLGKK